MIDVCLTHNQLAVDGGKWYPLPYGDDVMDVVLELQLPSCLKPECPMCQMAKAKVEETWDRR